MSELRGSTTLIPELNSAIIIDELSDTRYPDQLAAEVLLQTMYFISIDNDERIFHDHVDHIVSVAKKISSSGVIDKGSEWHALIDKYAHKSGSDLYNEVVKLDGHPGNELKSRLRDVGFGALYLYALVTEDFFSEDPVLVSSRDYSK